TLRRSPDDVESAHGLSVKVAFNPRPLECLGHDAVERAVPADRNRARADAERGEQSGEHTIALLPVGTRDVERDLRSAAIRRLPLDLDERRLSRPSTR